MSRDDYLTTTQAAQMAEISPQTLRAYSSRGQAPKPVWAGRGLYDAREFRAWLDARPGQGHRTDLDAARASDAERPQQDDQQDHDK